MAIRTRQHVLHRVTDRLPMHCAKEEAVRIGHVSRVSRKSPVSCSALPAWLSPLRIHLSFSRPSSGEGCSAACALPGTRWARAQERCFPFCRDIYLWSCGPDSSRQQWELSRAGSVSLLQTCLSSGPGRGWAPSHPQHACLSDRVLRVGRVLTVQREAGVQKRT